MMGRGKKSHAVTMFHEDDNGDRPTNMEHLSARSLNQPASPNSEGGATATRTTPRGPPNPRVGFVSMSALGHMHAGPPHVPHAPRSPGGPGRSEAKMLMSKTSSVFEALQNHDKVSTNPIAKVWAMVWSFSLHPHNRFHTIWDVYVLFLVMVSSIWAPYKVAFGAHPVFPLAEYAWWEMVIDVCFYMDIFITFWTGFDKGYEIVHDKAAVAKNYVKGWFWVDFLATVQWDIIIKSFADSGGRVLSLSRLLKILRLARASRLIMRLTGSSTVNTGYIDSIKLFFYVLMCAHFLGCFFFLIPELCGYEDCGHPSYEGEGELCIENSWRGQYEVPNGKNMSTIDELPPMSQYIQSIYWALTTMTTIGYGDRGPKLEEEVIFTMVAEILGLSFFALLITQINNLHEVLGLHEQKHNDIKNEIVGFMQYNGLEEDLIHEVIAFLNFKAKSHSGHSADEGEAQFRYLSLPLRKKIKVAQYLPALENVKLFGWSREDEEAGHKVRELFNGMDKDGGGSLDEGEISDLIQSLGITLTPEQLNAAVTEMDTDGGRTVALDEFKEWWYLKKFRRPMMPRCPRAFLQLLAEKMRTTPFSPHDVVVAPGEYGSRFYMVLLGQCKVASMRHISQSEYKEAETSATSPQLDEVMREVMAEDREPIFGLAAALETSAYESVREAMQDVFVCAHKYSDLAYVERSSLTAVLHQTWPEGTMHLERLAKWHYPKALEKYGALRDPGLVTVGSHMLAKNAAKQISALSANLAAGRTGGGGDAAASAAVAAETHQAAQEVHEVSHVLGTMSRRMDALDAKLDTRLDKLDAAMNKLLERESLIITQAH